MYDVIVSGAGPSGSKCAEVIAGAGYKVALIEKNTGWRKPCGGGVGARILKYYPQLKKLNLPKKQKVIMYSAQHYRMFADYEGYKDYSLVMDRLELDNLMRDIAVEKGAELLDNTLSLDFLHEGSTKCGIQAKSPEGKQEYRGKIMVIADGMSSKLAPKSGLRGKWKPDEIAMAKCAILEGESDLDPNAIYIYFFPYLGYGWIFPIDSQRFNIGAGTFNEANLTHNLNEVYTTFLNNAEIQKFLTSSNYKKIWQGSYPLPCNGILEKSLYGDNVMIIGDAAGYTTPISGEGIHASVVSGQIAGETAVQALEKEDYSKKTLRDYKKHRNIKKIIRNFKMKKAMFPFFFDDKGRNIDKMFKIAEEDEDFRIQVANLFLFNASPSKEFMARLRGS